jgi:hypothetical protein
MNNNNNNNNNNKFINKKGSKKGAKIDGKYIPSKEQKAQYLETYKNKPCYSLLLNCPLCDAQYIKVNENKHLNSKKHKLNFSSYEETKETILKNNITDENEQLKIFNEIKNKNIYNNYIETMRIKKPSYFENYKLFQDLKI